MCALKREKEKKRERSEVNSRLRETPKILLCVCVFDKKGTEEEMYSEKCGPLCS